MGTLPTSGEGSLHFRKGIGTFYDFMQLVYMLFPTFNDFEEMQLFWDDAAKLNDSLFGEQEAVEWANGFLIPTLTVGEFELMFAKSNYDIEAMSRNLQTDIQHSRMSKHSVEVSLSLNNPDRDCLIEIASRGMDLLLGPEFEANGPQYLPKLASAYHRVSSAVNKMMLEDYVQRGLAFILKKSSCINYLDDFHLSRLSWTSKSNKRKGRPIVDCSAGKGSRKLNLEFTKLSADQKYGQIIHPGIGDFAQMIVNHWNDADAKNLDEKDFVLWKADLSNAYTLLSFDPAMIKYVGAEMSDDLVIFFLCGIFGWNATPAAFQVVTRALLFEFQKRVKGNVNMYVDDVIGICLHKDVAHDIMVVRSISDGLFQTESIADEKVVFGRVMDVIGYSIDLDLKMVSVSEKNYLKCFNGFQSIDLSKKISITTIERLASWAVRYAEIFIMLKPYVQSFYEALRGKKNRYQCISITPELNLAIRVFQIIFATAVVHKSKLARSLQSFIQGHGQLAVQFDASLTGGGLLFYDILPNGMYVLRAALSVSLSRFNFKESKYQNFSEFLIAVVGLHVVAKVFPDIREVVLKGDSVTALSWCKKGRSNGEFCSHTSLVMIGIMIKYHVNICHVIHVPGNINVEADALSRGSSVQNVFGGQIEEVNYDPEAILSLCKVGGIPSTDEAFIELWKASQNL